MKVQLILNKHTYRNATIIEAIGMRGYTEYYIKTVNGRNLKISKTKFFNVLKLIEREANKHYNIIKPSID